MRRFDSRLLHSPGHRGGLRITEPGVVAYMLSRRQDPTETDHVVHSKQGTNQVMELCKVPVGSNHHHCTRHLICTRVDSVPLFQRKTSDRCAPRVYSMCIPFECTHSVFALMLAIVPEASHYSARNSANRLVWQAPPNPLPLTNSYLLVPL